MRKLPIILTLVLIAVWAYTSWYWYTCNIKGFCDGDVTYTSDISEKSEVNTSLKSQENGYQDEISLREGTGSSQRLSAEDVLFDPIVKEETQTEEEGDNQEELSGENTQSGSLDETKQETQEDGEIVKECSDQIVGNIVLGSASNQTEQVKKLERFLISRGEKVSVDGEYGNKDFEAMKRFQLEYKAEVLTPWGIDNPTGYVGKTTVKKINELLCQ